MQTNDRKTYGIECNLERYVLIIWSTFVFLTSIIGDSIIIATLSSRESRRIKSNKIIMTVMQHLAVVDLLSAIFNVLPRIPALITDSWEMGDFLGHVENQAGRVCYTVTALLTCWMTMFKLASLKFPLRTICWSKYEGHKICALLWMVATVINVPMTMGMLLTIADTLYFGYLWFGCSYDRDSPEAPNWLGSYYLICHGLVTIVPFLILLTTSVLILVTAKKNAARHQGKVRREGVLTVLLTVAVFLVSLLPYFVTSVLKSVGVMDKTVYRGTYFLSFLNTMANFFIYLLSVSSFREFLKAKLLKFCNSCLKEPADTRSQAALARNIISNQNSPPKTLTTVITDEQI